MSRMRSVVLAIVLVLAGASEFACADDAANAWKALRAGGHVAFMRHADAPGGFGDPPGFRVDDCATQRNLAAMVDNPADLEQPRPETPAYTPRRNIAFDKYRKGVPTTTTYPEADKAKLSDTGK